MTSQQKYGTLKEYRDDPSSVYRDNPSAAGYQDSRFGNYDRLHDELSSNIFQVNSNTTSLERLMGQIGSKNDTVKHREKLHEQQQRTNRIIAETATIFKNTKTIKSSTSQQKMNLTRLNSQFRETVERYNNIQKAVAERIRATKPMVPSSVKQGTTGKLIDIDSTVAWNEEDSDRQRYEEQQEQRRQQLQAQDDQITLDIELAQEREDQIRQLEGDILDINEIFKDLSNFVYDQGETIDTIESNVTKAHDNVEQGATQLQTASNYQKKYRKKLCIFAIIITIIAAIVVTIIVVEVKKTK